VHRDPLSARTPPRTNSPMSRSMAWPRPRSWPLATAMPPWRNGPGNSSWSATDSTSPATR
jgi:hypothetical protein